MPSRLTSRTRRSRAPSWPAGARCSELKLWMGSIRSGMTSRHQWSVRPSTGHLERPPFPWRCSSASKASKEPTHAGTDGIEVHVVIRICVVSAVALMAALPAGAGMFGPGFQPCVEKTSTLAVVECVQGENQRGGLIAARCITVYSRTLP
jgi:hypothetical protein